MENIANLVTFRTTSFYSQMPATWNTGILLCSSN